MDRNIELIALAKKGDVKAGESLVEENSRLIWAVVKKFTGRGVEAEDLFQIGAIGLIKSIKNFNLEYNVKFSTYAVPMIMGEIRRYLRDNGLIKVSRGLKELNARINLTMAVFEKDNNREPTVNEIADLLGEKVEDIILALDAGRGVESLNSVVYNNDGSEVYLIDKLEKSDSKNGTDSELEKIMLKEVLENLPQRDRLIIRLRFFEDKTQSYVAQRLGVSQVQISRLEKKILSQLRERLA